VYIEAEPIAAGTLAGTVKGRLAGRTEKTLYIKPDARTQYADVATVLDAARTAGVDATILVTGRREMGPAGGLQVSVGSSLPSGAESAVVRVLSSAQQNPTLTINDEQIPWSALQDGLKQLLQNRTEKVAFVNADGQLPFSQVVQVIDVCMAMGARVVLVVARV
jgi:biopolymer transport protein ExbD